MASAEEYVRMAYLVLLRREVDPTGMAIWREAISCGRFSEQQVINDILASDEYQSRFAIDLLGVQNRARQEWIRTVPRFDRILDIGGSSPTCPEGALIELGYPHRPSRLDILDKPPDEQYWGKPHYDQSVSSHFDWGEVNYFHGSGERVADVPGLQDRIYDCVFLGQAIEHIWPEQLGQMLAWIRSHLAQDGRLIFDTPNRLLTKIQCPESWIDPDHKHEYTPSEMEQVLEKSRFAVTRRQGVLHLARQAASGRYDVREFTDGALLSDDVNACYMFAFEAKPY